MRARAILPPRNWFLQALEIDFLAARGNSSLRALERTCLRAVARELGHDHVALADDVRDLDFSVWKGRQPAIVELEVALRPLEDRTRRHIDPLAVVGDERRALVEAHAR